jgi:heme/copper-type cytochrome/quinol oxidase subunit 2
MTESLNSFFDTMPVNHWSSVAIFILSIVFIVYSVYFFFSKEGKDERGKKIISTASFISFIIAILLLGIMNNFFYDVAVHSTTSYSWILNLMVMLISGTETISILILKKLN